MNMPNPNVCHSESAKTDRRDDERVTALRTVRLLGRAWAVLFALLCWPLGASAQNSTNQTVALQPVVIDVQGRVEFQPVGSTNWQALRLQQVLKPNERVHTYENSFVIVRVGKENPVRFGELSDFMFLPPAEPAGLTRLNLWRGLLYFFGREKPARLRLESPLCSTAIRGTEFVLEVQDSGRTLLTLVEGAATLTATNGAVDVKGGEQAVAELGKAPFLTVGITAVNVIQWCLYYPAVLDLAELSLTAPEQQALADSLAAYRAGDLRQALAAYPAGRTPASDAEKVFHSALLLAVGQVDKAAQQSAPLAAAAGGPTGNARLAAAHQRVIAAVKNQPAQSVARQAQPELATELLAESYALQAQHSGTASLQPALQAARQAVAKSPNFAFGWARVAELEFCFGHNKAASLALDKALALAPRNAQAVALKGFLLAGRNRTADALAAFDQAIALDGRLANAWLGRGLCRIRQGRAAEGRTDLLTAAAVEPQRALLRSYLGKAYSDAGDGPRATHELEIARGLDAQDPTPSLYSALQLHQQNRVKEAIGALERSQELNNNRSLYRSDLLLDQDRAVRSANLARLYSEAGLDDVAQREASRGVAADYGNYSAHLFLANSYAQMRTQGRFNLRNETVANNESLLAGLMGPADGRLLAQPLSQQEYTRLFERDTLGLSTSTEYLSRGAWDQYAVQYGTLGNSSYAVEGGYHWDRGETFNSSVESYFIDAKFKQMLTPQDGLYFEVMDRWQAGGYQGQLYDPKLAAPWIDGYHEREKQEPNLLLGFDHQWSDQHRTLFLASHITDSYVQNSTYGPTYLLASELGTPLGLVPADLTQQYRSRQSFDSVELQHQVRCERLQTLVGIRYQYGTDRLFNEQVATGANGSGLDTYFFPEGGGIVLPGGGFLQANQSLRLHSERLSPYIYEHWQVADTLWLIGGLSYDYQRQPRNAIFAPLGDGQETREQFSPKAAVVWTPTPRSAVRAAYTQSLGGNMEQSVRLEPSQVAGFVQSYRNLFPEGVVGGIAGARMEAADLSLEHRFPTRTYVAVGGEWLHSMASHDVGVFQRNSANLPSGPDLQEEERLRFQERSLTVSLHQLLSDWFNVGARYRVADVWLSRTYPGLGADMGPYSVYDAPDGVHPRHMEATSRGLLHMVGLSGGFQHPCGFFAGAEATWWAQDLGGESAASTYSSGDSFWQVNLQAGYRFPRRRAEITVGVLNVTGQDYRLYMINSYPDLARGRTFFARLALNF